MLTVLLLMLAMHVIEDFHLQGRMADMKQRSWWSQYPEMYDRDYIAVLILHGMEWSVLVSLPLLLVTGLDMPPAVVLAIVANGLIHAYVDDLKANRLRIDLITDQTVHIIQMLAVLLLTYYMEGML